MQLQRTILAWMVLISTYNMVSMMRIQNPTICSKENVNVGKHASIDTTANDFKNFVRNSDIFVDKSSLIENLVAKNFSFVSLMYPEKWGKSINLNMLKTFLEIEVDSKAKTIPTKTTWSYKFFKKGEITYENGTSAKLTGPPMVSRNDHIMNSYLGQYPVIHLDLSSFTPASLDFDGFFTSFQKRIANVFEKHDYMTEVFRDQLDDCNASRCDRQSVKNLLAKFKSYRTGLTNSQEDVTNSLVFLSTILKSHFNQKVYVLIDDYDVIIRKSYFETPSPVTNEIEKIVEFYATFISKTFGSDDRVQMGIVTGIFSTDVFASCLGSFSPINYDLLSRNTPPFYGFTTNEVNQLLARRFANYNLTKAAIEYYKAYRIGDFLDIVVYDPWSIVNFANQRNLNNFRFNMKHSGSSFILCKKVRDWLIGVTQGRKDSIRVQFHDLTFQKEDLKLIKNYTNGDQLQSKEIKLADLGFAYLYASGCFTLEISTSFVSRETGIKIKLQYRNTVTNIMENYSMKFENEIEGIAKLLLKFFQYEEYKQLESHENESKNLTEFHKMYKTNSRDRQSAETGEFYCLHFLVAMHMNKKFNYSMTFDTPYHSNIGVLRPYIVLEKSNHRAIIEFEYSTVFTGNALVSTENVLNRAKKFNAIFKDKPSVKTSFVGIDITFSPIPQSNIQIDMNPN